jgi:hypothetical protein
MALNRTRRCFMSHALALGIPPALGPAHAMAAAQATARLLVGFPPGA